MKGKPDVSVVSIYFYNNIATNLMHICRILLGRIGSVCPLISLKAYFMQVMRKCIHSVSHSIAIMYLSTSINPLFPQWMMCSLLLQKWSHPHQSINKSKNMRKFICMIILLSMMHLFLL